MPTHRRPGLVCAAAALVACTTVACRPRTGSAPPPSGPSPVAWYEGDALQARPIPGDASGSRVARLDVLLDLLDAARFADDDAARESLWLGLGGTARGRGPEATRDAATRLLGEALKLDAAADLDDDAHHFVAGVIAILSADLGLVGAAEDLAIRTAAYRDVAESGHPRAADNARWRLYDHVRGCLVGAVTAPQERRVDIAVHALYVREDSLAAWLDDRAVHARPPLPTPAELVDLLAGPRADLGAEPRWAVVVDRRARADETLERTVRTALPAPRDPTWPLAVMPTGTARPDGLAPVVRIDDRQVTVDLGHPDARTHERGAPELVRALSAALARDGRGAVLLVAPPMLPSPAVNSITRSLLDARVARVELAVREPRVAEGAGDVVVQLPLEVLRDSDQGPAAVALRKARLHLHIGGRGVRLAADGRWHDLRPGPAELEVLLARLRRAYPREHMITLALGDDLLYQQLLDALRAIVGGTVRRFDVAAWAPAVAPPPDPLPPRPVAAEEKRLQLRADLYPDTAAAAVQRRTPPPAQPPAPEAPGTAPKDPAPPAIAFDGDQRRLEALARQLLRCLPELETPLRPGQSLALELRFDEGRLAAITPKAPGARKDRLTAVQTCADEESRGFRLREQQGTAIADILLTPR
jgi:hypothetical protein